MAIEAQRRAAQRAGSPYHPPAESRFAESWASDGKLCIDHDDDAGDDID